MSKAIDSAQAFLKGKALPFREADARKDIRSCADTTRTRTIREQNTFQVIPLANGHDKRWFSIQSSFLPWGAL
jgi:hypothetical protein